MLVRSVRGLNTTAGLHSYSVAVICRPEQISIVGESLGACSLQSHAAFVHQEGCKEHKYYTTLCTNDIIPSEARLYSGSIDLFRGHGHGHGGHGPPLYPATSLAIAYQTRSEHLLSL